MLRACGGTVLTKLFEAMDLCQRVQIGAFRVLRRGKDFALVFAVRVAQWALSVARAPGLIPDKLGYLAY